MAYVVIYCDVQATDGIDEPPLEHIELIGIADDIPAAVALIQDDMARKPEIPAELEKRNNEFISTPWFRDPGDTGNDELRAGYWSTSIEWTYYRAIPIK